MLEKEKKGKLAIIKCCALQANAKTTTRDLRIYKLYSSMKINFVEFTVKWKMLKSSEGFLYRECTMCNLKLFNKFASLIVTKKKLRRCICGYIMRVIFQWNFVWQYFTAVCPADFIYSHTIGSIIFSNCLDWPSRNAILHGMMKYSPVLANEFKLAKFKFLSFSSNSLNFFKL